MTERESVPRSDPTQENVLHASCVCLEGRAVLIRGASGSGKSGLALQLIALGAALVADDRTVAELYDMIHPNQAEKVTVRSVFVIDHNKKVRLTLTYPPSTGRNFNEILRVIDSLQLTDNYSVATPVDWKHGEDVVISPKIADEDIPAKFPKGHTKIKPYLRTTPQPNID